MDTSIVIAKLHTIVIFAILEKDYEEYKLRFEPKSVWGNKKVPIFNYFVPKPFIAEKFFKIDYPRYRLLKSGNLGIKEYEIERGKLNALYKYT